MVLYDGSEDDGTDGNGGGNNPPLLENQDKATTAWINEDKNGDYYLVIDMPHKDNFNIFVKDKFKRGFNDVINHYVDEGELQEDGFNGGGD